MINLYWILPAVYELFFIQSGFLDPGFVSFAALKFNTPSIYEAFVNLGYFRPFYSLAIPGFLRSFWVLTVYITLIVVLFIGNFLNPDYRTKKIWYKEDENNKELKIMFLSVVEYNKKFSKVINKQKQQIGDIIPRIGNTTNNLYVKMFLQESCKDSINIS